MFEKNVVKQLLPWLMWEGLVRVDNYTICLKIAECYEVCHSRTLSGQNKD